MLPVSDNVYYVKLDYVGILIYEVSRVREEGWGAVENLA